MGSERNKMSSNSGLDLDDISDGSLFIADKIPFRKLRALIHNF